MGESLNATAPSSSTAEGPQEMTLRELFVKHFGCDPQAFEREVLFQCSHAPTLVRLVWRIDPDFFAQDLQVIRTVGLCRSFGDCRHEVEALRRANPPRGLLRKTLRIRLSGQKLLKLASRLYLNKVLPSRNGNVPPQEAQKAG